MDILQAIANNKKAAQVVEDKSRIKLENPELFRQLLYQAGCDDETIEDCLFEPVNEWENLLKYFEGKK